VSICLEAGAQSSRSAKKGGPSERTSLSKTSQREKKYIEEAEKIMLSKSKRNMPFQVLQSMEDGCLCLEGSYDSFFDEITYDGNVFFWIDATSRFMADDETFRKDLFWCGTYQYTTVKDLPKTVNKYTTDRDLAILIIRFNFDLYDDDDDEEESRDVDDDDFEITGTGSGFFITKEGHVLTNYHVIEDNDIVIAAYDGGEEVDVAMVIRKDAKKDLALLKMDVKSVPVALGVPEGVQPGRTVFALGFPNPELQGVAPKVTMGIISALTGMHDDEDNYQIDAAVQPGNSGGPLFCADGQVIGVVSARVNDSYYVETTGTIAQKINYAVKAEAVLSFLKEDPDVYRLLKRDQPSASSQEEAVKEITRSLVHIITVE
jgi:S1-C subfamily serine protease